MESILAQGELDEAKHWRDMLLGYLNGMVEMGLDYGLRTGLIDEVDAKIAQKKEEKANVEEPRGTPAR